jgi:hypothetical protein
LPVLTCPRIAVFQLSTEVASSAVARELLGFASVLAAAFTATLFSGL